MIKKLSASKVRRVNTLGLLPPKHSNRECKSNSWSILKQSFLSALFSVELVFIRSNCIRLTKMSKREERAALDIAVCPV